MKTLTLSGWTQPSDAVARALDPAAATFDYSDYASPEATFSSLKKFADAEHVIGWSMGGQLALRAVAAGVLKPKRLTLLAAPYQFLRSAQVTQAMEEQTFRTFRDNYAADPERTASRFHALVAKGDRKLKQILDGLAHHQHVLDTKRWLPWFDDLGQTSLREVDLSNVPETLIIHGTEDTIVPVAQSVLLAKALPRARLEQWEGVAHAPHLHDPARVLASMDRQRSAA